MCGLCVEACPTRALTLTSYYELAFDSREDAIWTKEQLLRAAAAARHRPRGPGGLVVPVDNSSCSGSSRPISVGVARSRCCCSATPCTRRCCLIVNFFCLAVFYLLLGAPFLFAVQIIVYAGAIMVLFLFVIMLLGVDRARPARRAADRAAAGRDRARRRRSSLEVTSPSARASASPRSAPAGFDAVNEGGNAQALAQVLFSDYFFPFEVTSILLIVAAIAAMVLAQRTAARRRHAGRDRAPHAATRRPRRRPGARWAMRTPIAYFLVARRRCCSRSARSGVLMRRNALIIFMSVELQLNAVNLSLVAFSRHARRASTARSWRSSRWSWRPPRSSSGSRSSWRCTGGASPSTSTTRAPGGR